MRLPSIGGLLLATCAISTPAVEPIRFRDVTSQAGLVEPLAGLLGHGGAWGDVDSDGDLDLYVGGFADRPNEEYAPAPGPVGSRLFLNSSGGFSAAPAPGQLFARTSGAVFVDWDNDGWLDLYVANNAKPAARSRHGETQAAAQQTLSRLYHNRAGELVDISEECGACPPGLHTARNIAVFDYDQDGWLDLLVIEDRFRKNPRSTLLRNEGGLRFRDVTQQAGLPDDLFGLGHAVADLNADGDPDIFVAHSNRMFLSNGDGTYHEPASLRETFAWNPLHGEDWPCGAAFGDLNNDGQLDLVVSIHCETARNRVYLNRGLHEGIPQFEDVSGRCGMPDVVPARCPHVEVQDFDNDGRLDIYLSAGWLDGDTFVPLILQNSGNDRDGIPRFAIPREVDGPMVYYPAGPSADFDQDGDLDLFLINWFEGNHSRLLANETAGGNFLQVNVTSDARNQNSRPPFNRMGIGSRISVFTAGDDSRLLGTQEVQVGFGYASGQPAVCHFGLGDVEAVDLAVRLPDGSIIRHDNVTVNQRITVHP